jgi:hypothetical protein
MIDWCVDTARQYMKRIQFNLLMVMRMKRAQKCKDNLMYDTGYMHTLGNIGT